MMNGNSAIRFREYERAVERLRAISTQLETEEGRDAALSKIHVGLARDLDSTLPGIRAVAEAVGKAIKAELPNYFDGLLVSAQADVRGAADALIEAVKADLGAKYMKRPAKS